ncbi:sulfatase-like hydrolase/transferase [Noviherbaspirillum saxi]|nr:sulfatase-like hydrolase/transferase [Noviherbaspirillum saxi]
MDVAVWYCIPSIFLFFYVHYHAVSSEAIGPHLYLLLIGLLSLVLSRLVLYRLIPDRRVAHIVTSCVISAVLLSMLLYYGLVLIGLGSWARVISWDLITSYTMQLPGLMDSLGVPVYVMFALFAVVYVALTYATHAYIQRFEWVSRVLPVIPGWLHLFIVTAGFAVCSIAVYRFMQSPPVQKSEPLSLTFFPMFAARDLQGHAIDKIMAQKLDRLEDAARSSYMAKKEGLGKRNLILIVVDALRPDHMGIYGYRRNTTPNLAHMIQSGQARIVKNVRSSCGESACGLLSLASSKFVYQFSNKPFTLQQVLRRQGYQVQMILGGDHTSFYGLKELYGEVDSYFDGSMATGYYVNDDQLVLDHTGRLPSWDGKPVMMQFHLMSTHVMGKRHGRFAQYAPSENYMFHANRIAKNNDKHINFYDNGVVQADAVIHDLLAALQSKGYLKDALVVITADHGEALGEHGLYAHANSVREEALRIPLIFIPYGYQSGLRGEFRTAAAQVDIAPTILAEFGFSIPSTWAGSSMQDTQRKSYSYFQEGQAAGVIDYRDPENLWKYWFDAKSGHEHAYNLTRDPMEKDNVISQVASGLKQDWRLQQMQLMPGIQDASHLRRE